VAVMVAVVALVTGAVVMVKVALLLPG